MKYQEIDINLVTPDQQVRHGAKSYSETMAHPEESQSIIRLANDINQHGLMYPVVVCESNDRFRVIDGHRRLFAITWLIKACKWSGSSVPCFIWPDMTRLQTVVSQLSTDIHKSSYNVYEVARGMRAVFLHLKENGGEFEIIDKRGEQRTVVLQPSQPDKEVWEAIEQRMGIQQSRRYQIQAILGLKLNILLQAEQANVTESRLRYLLPLNQSDAHKQIVKDALDYIIQENPSNSEIKAHITHLKKRLPSQLEADAALMPKPAALISATNSINKIYGLISQVGNVTYTVSSKSPRTVESYRRKVLPALDKAIRQLIETRESLGFLDDKEEE